jgi:hypothetical protein
MLFSSFRTARNAPIRNLEIVLHLSPRFEIPGSMRSLSSGRPKAGPVGIAPE